MGKFATVSTFTVVGLLGVALVVPLAFLTFVSMLIGGGTLNSCFTPDQIVLTPQRDVTPEPEEAVARALAVVRGMGGSERVEIAEIMIGRVESRYDPTLTEAESDADSSGWAQHRRPWVPEDLQPEEWTPENQGSLGWVADDPRVNLEWAVANTLDPFAPGFRGLLYWDGILPDSVSAGTLAQIVQGSAHPERYDEVVDEVVEMIERAEEMSVGMCLPGTGGPTIVGDVACPVGQPNHFSDTWGAPRSGGRSHKGVDIFSEFGMPLYAYTSGTVRRTSSALGGVSLWITSETGDAYYYAHLSGYAIGTETGSEVEMGQMVGYNGNSGNARYTPPHLHWEIRPGGGAPINPTPYARAACGVTQFTGDEAPLPENLDDYGRI